MVTTTMTLYEFMVKPLIEAALERKDFDYLNTRIKNGDIFSGEEINITDYKKYSPCTIGDSCRLYFECKLCKETKRYSEYPNIIRLRRGDRYCIPCKSIRRQEQLLKNSLESH